MPRSSEVVVAIDERPLSLSMPTALDYVGRLMCGALAEPLLRVTDAGKLEPAAAESWRVLEGHRVYEFSLRRGRVWSDGTPLEPMHFALGLKRARSNPYWAHQLRAIRAVQMTPAGDLRIALTQPTAHFPFLLATPDLAPAPAAGQSVGVSNGTHILTEVSDASYLFSPNPHYPGADARPALRFEVMRDPRTALAAFDDGELHATCNTAFPFDELAVRRDRPEFREQPSCIWMQLEPGSASHPALAARELRTALFNAIDQERIAGELYGGLSPARYLGPSSFARERVDGLPAFSPSRARQLAQSRLDRPLVLGYHDYYPNREVVLAVARQWKSELGIPVTLAKFPFAEPTVPACDWMLMLRFPTYQHELAALETVYYSRLTDSCLRDAIEDAGVGDDARAEARRLDALRRVANELPVLPLFHLHSYYCVKDGLAGFRYPTDSAFDFREVTCATQV